MTESDAPLVALRSQIDEIDAAIHDLLMRRAAVADEVARAKGGGLAWRPARGARVLRRLMERHRGAFPPRTVVHIWREIVSAMTRLQGDFSVAVYAPWGEPASLDAARDHFGCEAAIESFGAGRKVLDAVEDGSAAVGVLAVPKAGAEAGWWDLLADGGDRRAAICAELPFAPTAGRSDRFFCVAAIAPEESGDDRTLVVLHAGSGIGCGEIEAEAASAGLAAPRVRESAAGAGRYFVEFAGFAAPGDARLDRLARIGGGTADAVGHLGAWPAPLAAPAPANGSVA